MGGNRRQRAVVEHGGNRLGQFRAHGRMAFDKIGEPGQNDGTGHPFRLGRAEGGGGGEGRPRRMAPAFLLGEAQMGALTIAAGHAIDDDAGIAVEQFKKVLPCRCHRRLRHGRNGDGLIVPGDAAHSIQGDVGAASKRNGHGMRLRQGANEIIPLCHVNAPRARVARAWQGSRKSAPLWSRSSFVQTNSGRAAPVGANDAGNPGSQHDGNAVKIVESARGRAQRKGTVIGQAAVHRI